MRSDYYKLVIDSESQLDYLVVCCWTLSYTLNKVVVVYAKVDEEEERLMICDGNHLRFYKTVDMLDLKNTLEKQADRIGLKLFQAQ